MSSFGPLVLKFGHLYLQIEWSVFVQIQSQNPDHLSEIYKRAKPETQSKTAIKGCPGTDVLKDGLEKYVAPFDFEIGKTQANRAEFCSTDFGKKSVKNLLVNLLFAFCEN